MNKEIFIAIPFHKDFDEIYLLAIEKGILESGYTPYRVDELKKNSDIIQDIEEGIKKSFLVFADLTSKNPNVFFEVGFARAIGKNVIPATQNSDDVPFDLRQRRYINYNNTPQGLAAFKNEIKLWIKEIEKDPTKYSLTPKVQVHGTKYNVPNSNEFWNDLCLNANKRFYLLGFGNKSWIDKDDSQSDKLAQSMVRIISSGGIVKIISQNTEDTIANHRLFYEKFIKKYLVKSIIKRKWLQNFEYGVTNKSNYQAVVSDERLVILPRMNSQKFVNESLVLELEGSHQQAFKNYQADIERLFKEPELIKINIADDK